MNPKQSIVQRAVSNVRNTANRLLNTAQNSLARQNITSPQQFANKVFDPQAFTNTVARPYQNTPVSFPANYVANKGANILSGLQAPFNNKPLLQKAGDVVGGIGTIFKPVQTAQFEAMTPLFQTGASLLPKSVGGNKRLPTRQELAKGFYEGQKTAPQIAALTAVTNPLINKAVGSVTPLVNNTMGKFVLNRLATGALNIPEGMAISSASGNPYGTGAAATDFLMGAVTGSQPTGKFKVKGFSTKPMLPDDVQAVQVLKTKLEQIKGLDDFIKFESKHKNVIDTLAEAYLDTPKNLKGWTTQQKMDALFERASYDFDNRFQMSLSPRGPFGSIYTRFKNKPDEAIDFLLQNKAGETKGAIRRADIGDIDLVWGKGGKNGYGIAHILEKHGEGTVRALPKIIQEGSIKKLKDRIYIDTPNHRSAIRLDWNGKEKKWVVTAFVLDKKNPALRISPTSKISTTTGQNSAVDTSIIPPAYAKVKIFVTKQDVQQLMDLGYKREQINKMKPAEVQKIIEDRSVNQALKIESEIRDNAAKIQKDFMDGKIDQVQRDRLMQNELNKSTTKQVSPDRARVEQNLNPTQKDLGRAMIGSVQEDLGKTVKGDTLPWETPQYKDTGMAPPPKTPPPPSGEVPKGDPVPVFKQKLQTWRNKILGAKQRADLEAPRFKDIPEEKGLDIIKFIQNPTKQKAKELNLDVNKYRDSIYNLRAYYNSVRQEGIKRGLDIGYLDNYINQTWKQSPKEIFEMMDKVRGIGKVPSFVKERRIPTYEEGIKFGLTPKFTHPGQLAAHYRMQMEKAVAAQKLLKELSKEGLVQQLDNAPFGWKVIDAPLVPDLNGKFAPKQIAQELSNLFGTQPDNFGTKLVDVGSKISNTMQDVTLSGGIRTLNAFSLGNMIKEFTAGRFISPIQAFVRSFADAPSKSYFKENGDVLKEMADNGIPVRTNLDYNKAYENILESKSMKSKIGNFWNDNVNKPTFARFLPMLQVEFYKDAIKQGMTPQEAAKAVKNFYGVVDNFSRPKWAEDTLSTIFFAPKFRESMINFWLNNAKSLGVEGGGRFKVRFNPALLKDKTYGSNRKFLAGTLITYIMYSALNKQLTGRWMHENKDGKEFSIEIPRGEGRSWFIPMLPSVGTLPRRVLEMGGSLAGGDIAGATQKAGSFFSQPISLGSQLATNKTFYGGPIYKDEDPALTKVGKLAGYGIGQSLHPLLGEPIEVFQGRKTPLEAGLGMLEMPVYPSRSSETSGLVGTQFNKYKEILSEDEQKAKEYLEEAKVKKEENKLDKQAKTKLENSDDTILQANNKIYYKDEEGDIRTLNLSNIQEKPQFTGNPVENEQVRTSYVANITRKQNILKDLYINKEISEAEFRKLMGELSAAKYPYLKVKTSASRSGGRRGRTKIKMPKLKKLKVKKPKKIKVKKVKLQRFKLAKLLRKDLKSKKSD